MKKIALILFITSYLIANETKVLPSIPEIDTNANQMQQTPDIKKDNNTTTIDNISNLQTNTTNQSDKRDPFKAQMTPKESGQLSNTPNLNLFTKTEINLPSTARKIKKVTIEYQNLNGSITSIEKEVDGDIDWHFPLVVNQDMKPKVTEKPTKNNFILGENFKFDINVQDKKLILNTPYKLLRDFTLASPTRLVLDFKNPSKKEFEDGVSTNLSIITDATLQTHLDFFRITLNLDGQYNYTLTQNKNEFTIEFQ